PHLSRASAAAFLADVSDPKAMAPAFQLLSLYAGGPREVQAFGDAAPVQRDDRMALEFSAPRAIYGRSTSDNTATIRALASPDRMPRPVRTIVQSATGVSWTARGLMELKAEAYAEAYDDLQRAVMLAGGNAVALADALRGLSDAAAGASRQQDE